MATYYYDDCPIERYTLHKKGFGLLKIRKICDEWQMLVHVSNQGDERWLTLKNIPVSIILEHIELYAVTGS